MSEQATAAPRPAASSRAPGKKYAGLSRNQWLIVGGVFAAALGYILWKRHQAAASAASTSTSTSTSTAAQLAALENELAQLQAQGYGAGAGSGSSGGVAGTGGGPAYSTTTSTPAGTPTSTSGTTSGGTTTGTTTAAPAAKAGAISNLAASSETTTSAKVSWNKASNATQGYAYKVTQLNGTLVKSGNTSATSVTITGLHPGWTYNFGVQGLPGGPGNNIHFTTKSS